MQNITYLDYAATTPVDPLVAEKMSQFLTLDGIFANPASRSHVLGWQAEAAVENARKQVAGLLNADTREIVWTSGATEANNLAIKGVAEALKDKGRHIITSKTEHKAVLDCALYLEERGFEVTWLSPNEKGYIDVSRVQEAIRPDTILISVMHVNNETGAINENDAIAELAATHNILFHIDAAQSAGKLVIDTTKLKADLISLSAHKIYGPKGIGALYVRRRPGFNLPPLIHGGGHERGMRSGTLATHQIAGMGEAFHIAKLKMEDEQKKLAEHKRCFLSILEGLDALTVNADQAHCVPGILNLSFQGIDGQVLLSALPKIAISSGSACNSASMAPSHVLSAMGLSDEMALNSIRISFGRFTSADDVVSAGQYLRGVVENILAK